jgi:alginate O-acetyltransferase complex protein AlgI
VIERLTGIARMDDGHRAALRRGATFLLVVLGWVTFRADGLGQAVDFYAAMAGFDFGALSPATSAALGPQQAIAICVGLLTVLLPRDFVMGKLVMERWSGGPLVARFAVVGMLPYAAVVVAAGSFSPFLYFQF